MELDQQVAGLCLFDKCQKFVADGFRTANDDRGAFVEFLPVFGVAELFGAELPLLKEAAPALRTG